MIGNITSRKTKGNANSTHFWTIACIMVALVLFYNANYIGIANWFPWFREVLAAQGAYAFVPSFLFLIPLLYAGAIFRLRGALVTWAVFLAAILPRAIYESPNFESLLRVALFALIALLLSTLVALNYSPGLREETLKPAKATRRISLARILKAQEYERRHVAQELHDNVIQTLLVIANRARALEIGNYGDLTPEAKKQAEEILVMLLHTIDDVRRLSYSLSARVLDNTGLLPALKWLAERFTQDSGIRVEVRINGREHRLRPELEIAIFRIAQEALNNVVQHSKATVAVVTLNFAGSNFKVTVQDNGQGFCLPETMSDNAANGKLGLERMQQQARLVDGTFNILSEPGRGTTITVEVMV